MLIIIIIMIIIAEGEHDNRIQRGNETSNFIIIGKREKRIGNK